VLLIVRFEVYKHMSASAVVSIDRIVKSELPRCRASLSWDVWLARVLEHNNRMEFSLTANEVSFLKRRWNEGTKPVSVFV
jgi:hypothetical protein